MQITIDDDGIGFDDGVLALLAIHGVIARQICLRFAMPMIIGLALECLRHFERYHRQYELHESNTVPRVHMASGLYVLDGYPKALAVECTANICTGPRKFLWQIFDMFIDLGMGSSITAPHEVGIKSRI